MNTCKFEKTDKQGTYLCTVCNRTIKSKTGNIARFCIQGAKNQLAQITNFCTHRGEATGTAVKVTCANGSKHLASFYCPLYKRCIPEYAPQGKPLKEWHSRPESRLYNLCAFCADRKTS